MPFDMVDALYDLKELLETQNHLSQIKARKYGNTLVLYSVAGDDELKHARFINLEDYELWELSFPHHTGRWERTHLVGSLPDLFHMLVHDFNFYLNPDR